MEREKVIFTLCHTPNCQQRLTKPSLARSHPHSSSPGGLSAVMVCDRGCSSDNQYCYIAAAIILPTDHTPYLSPVHCKAQHSVMCEWVWSVAHTCWSCSGARPGTPPPVALRTHYAALLPSQLGRRGRHHY